MAGVLFTKLLAHFTPTGGAFLALHIASAISLIRDRVGDSPWSSSFSVSLVSTSSSITVILLLGGVNCSLVTPPWSLRMSVILETL
jgi:hypothetical protein